MPVVYTGSVPDLFRAGRHVYLRGKLENGVFVAERDSLVTKCPSKYAPPKTSEEQVPGLGRAALVVALGLVLYAALAGGSRPAGAAGGSPNRPATPLSPRSSPP